MVPVPIIPSPPILEPLKTSMSLSPWRNGISSLRQLSSEILPLSCAYVLLVALLSFHNSFVLTR